MRFRHSIYFDISMLTVFNDSPVKLVENKISIMRSFESHLYQRFLLDEWVEILCIKNGGVRCLFTPRAE